MYMDSVALLAARSRFVSADILRRALGKAVRIAGQQRPVRVGQILPLARYGHLDDRREERREDQQADYREYRTDAATVAAACAPPPQNNERSIQSDSSTIVPAMTAASVCTSVS